MSGIVYLNGEFLDAPNARVSAFDGGWLHGAGLFETMRAESGTVFRLEAHLARLRRSIASLLPHHQQETLPSQSVFSELLNRNDLTSARIRLTVTSGLAPNPQVQQEPNLTVCLTAVRLEDYPRECYDNGVQVAICNHRLSATSPIAGHKTTCYLPWLLGLREAQEAHCLEAIWFTTEAQLAEGSISNVFILKDEVLKTPPLDTPVLPGIARAVVLESAEKLGIDARETAMNVDDLLDADEVLLTNAIMQVMPVVRIERRDVGDGRVGSLARRLLDQYREIVKTECHNP